MRRGLAATVIVTAVTALGCGAEQQGSAVITGTPPATPYDGPLYVPHKEIDEDSLEATRTESGAAGRALECDGEIYSGGGGPGGWGENDGGETPEEGLEAYFDIEQPDVPEEGYRVEREEKDRVLFLSTGGEADGNGRLYGRDPEGVLPDSMLTSAYDGDARMPANARDTGYRYEDRELWLVDDDPSKAYIRTSDGVEAWPAVKEGMGCA